MNLPRRSFIVFTVAMLSLGTGFALTGKESKPGFEQLSAARGTKAVLAHYTGETVLIPGPLRPFLRMTGISQEISPDEVMPMLARNISLWGYEGDKPTEFLKLAEHYVELARELQKLAGPDGKIHVANCEGAGPLIQALGYQFAHGCSHNDASLITADPERAFLTTDSGFPLTELEDALKNGRPFSCDFPATQVPVMFTEKTWTAMSVWNKRYENTLLDVVLHDRNLDRLYSAMARLDPETRTALQRNPGMRKLLQSSAALDFYGGWISIRNGEVAVPGGAAAEQAWKDLVGASPKSAGDFVNHLLTKDRGATAAYFDAISRLDSAQQAHFTDAGRLKRLYEAYEGAAHTAHNSAAEGVFPRNAALLELLTRLQWQADGTPQVPGGLDVWKDIASHKVTVNSKKLPISNPHGWTSSEQLLEALVASSVQESDTGPLQVYLVLTAIDSGRPEGSKLSEPTVRTMIERFREFDSWYTIFAEFPGLEDASINQFIETAEKIDRISNPSLRTNALGAFQAEVSMWQIFARQGQIPGQDLNSSWQKVVHPFASANSNTQLFEASQIALQSLVTAAASGETHISESLLVDLLAGPAQNTPDGKRAHQQLARRIQSVIDDQRLVSIDTLIGLYEGLDDAAKGKSPADQLLPLAAELREFEMPRPIFTGNERAAWAPVVYTNRHAELQVRTDLTKIINSHGSPDQLEAARGRLTPFLRDTLVGMVYAYYEPPGAQVLHNNPLFVRSHDFTASSVEGIEHVWGPPELVGIGVTAGGGAYLLGSLADLPYALASVEQDFISPAKVQALIWKEIVPEFLVDSVLPRWWGVRPDEMHAATLYQRAGEELLVVSATNPRLKAEVLGILTDHLSPARLEQTTQALDQADAAKAFISHMLPAELFFLAVELRNKFPGEASAGPAGQELDALIKRDPTHTDPKHVAKTFGVPHPQMAQSNSCTILNRGIFPASGAFQGRLFGESWESSNLYWARLADEMGYAPAMLNVLVPNLTRYMVANIFATNIDDWPAVLRAMRETGDDFRAGKISVNGVTNTAGQIQGIPVAAMTDGRQ